MSGVSPEPTLQPDSLTEMRFTPLVEKGTMNARYERHSAQGSCPEQIVSPSVLAT